MADRCCVFPGKEQRGDAHTDPLATTFQSNGISVEPNKSPVRTAGAGCCHEDPAAEWTAHVASSCWWDLLANDAGEQADPSNFIHLPPHPIARAEERKSRSLNQHLRVHSSPALLNGQATLPEDLDPESERQEWQRSEDIVLSHFEALLFRHFAERCATWLDLLDPHSLFSTYAIRLALRNVGLMKAILALSANHQTRSASCSMSDSRSDGDDIQVHYYYETLHYVREALQYSSYSHSEELLATALIISAYEMLEEANGSGNWQRHLKGIFWIQRSQDVDGGCGGLRQSVWWAWLRQDIWAAFREQRPCQTIWTPGKNLDELDKHGLANHALYLLSQAVNYSATARQHQRERTSSPLESAWLSKSMQLTNAKQSLLDDLERWKVCFGTEITLRLPVASESSSVFQPIWVHPPSFASALQAYSLALILITLHSPDQTGFDAYVKMQKTLSVAINTICGVAMELRAEGSQVLSAQCLYGAGLCLQEPEKRNQVLHMIEECEFRVGWAPMAVWRADLREAWAKADLGNE